MGVMDCVMNVGKITPTESIEVLKVQASNSTLNEPKRDLESQSANINTKKHSIWWTLVIDVPLLLVLAGSIGAFEKGLIPTNKYGFYCNDPAISFKSNGEVVSGNVLMATVFSIPIFVFLIIESIFVDSEYSKSKFKRVLLNTFWLYRNYIYGILANLAIVELMKGIVGAPRPVFFDLCEPDTAKTCNGSEFVSTYQCTSTKYSWWDHMDSHRSFPSGHTSLSVYCGFFVAWYLQKRAFDWQHRTVFVVPVLQILCVTYSAVCSLTRLTDHRHHWWDVLTGSVIAAISLFYSVIAVGDNFSYVTSKSSDDDVIRCGGSQQTVTTILYEEKHREIVS